MKTESVAYESPFTEVFELEFEGGLMTKASNDDVTEENMGW